MKGQGATLVIASRNRDKIRELANLLEGLPLAVRAAEEFPDVPVVIEETAPDLHGNALIKARTVAKASGQWALADDTGLEVDALGGAPGVETARFAGPDATYEENVAMLLERMAGAGPGRRGARFRTVVALCDPDGRATTVEGVCEGKISRTPVGKSGFGYDPVFAPEEAGGKTFAQMSMQSKGAISHRGRAMVAALSEIERRILGQG
ncbi:MAG: non-canonical purine NTP pyrophosphatase, RdgB/HAM1 family [Gemmatimonadetes bacterium]|nr:non-canonical purine NTP pyrophosphatase, RdgB/HAM1 family [Gemmatimonadota bacterium]